MSKIRILSEQLTNKIAAGEVVQRPASLVKELVENSLDAGATAITINIRNGGKTLCEVSDNGEGMTRDDLLLAFERYATSKISTVEDLLNIRTLGFRGEALASIAAVAVVEATSTLPGAESGHTLRIEGGSFRYIQPAAPQPGTTISARNLFYNIPARRKFLKSAEVEYRHVCEVVQKFALSRPQVQFQLIHNEHEVLRLEPQPLPERIAELFSSEYATNLLSVTHGSADLQIRGYIGNLNLVRARRGEQFLFVNQRFVTDRLLNHAIVSAYGSLLSRNEYPFYCLDLELDPLAVDVNVHPTKMEVKFREQEQIYQFCQEAVKISLQSILAVIPDLGIFTPERYYTPPPPPASGAPVEQLTLTPPKAIITPEKRIRRIDSPPETDDVAPSESTESTSKWQERARRFSGQNLPADSIERHPGAQVFQLHNKYILSQIKSGLVVIDQHVAHERILYEEALESLQHTSWRAQQLLFPVILELTPTDFSVLLEILPFLEKLGFRMKEFGKQTVAIEAVPAGMRWGNEKTIIKEILDYYQEYGTKDTSRQEKVAAAYACKAAIKSGDSLTTEEMQTLVDHLFATQNPYHCPHGRPIIVNLSLKELDKRFERI